MNTRRLASAYRSSVLAAVRRQPISYSSSPRNALFTRRHAGRRAWPVGSNAIHNLPAVRHVSFARVIPQLAMKLMRIPAMFGVAMVGGVAYLQYQAAQAGTYALDVFGKAKDAAGTAANSIFDGAGDIFSQIGKGYDKTASDLRTIQMPQWMKDIYEGRTGEGGEGGSGGPNEPKKSGVGAAAAGAATAGAFALSSDGEEDNRSEDVAARDDQMMLLTRKMIEIRTLLQGVGQDSLTLPSIVVVGSQSSGKSSVLEAIVGHEFLPKGSNMVTRRPIELTLVNTPGAQAEYGEFTALSSGKITDFGQIRRTLTDLNLEVPMKDCVSDDPIQLRISSPNVPDLSLIDLPGYIQIESADQPPELRTKITKLCEKYIKPPNIILAISSAEDDLANSTALRESRRVDPRGERTIGVITKMDLVDPVKGAAMLSDGKYPLRLGYVGVVCKIPQETRSLFSKGSANLAGLITKNESAFFNAHSEYKKDAGSITIGTPKLRKKLMQALEATMSASLSSTRKIIVKELGEVMFNFKARYQERNLTTDAHLAASLDSLKFGLKTLSDNFGTIEVRETVKQEFGQQVLNILAEGYWNRPIEDLRPVDDLSESFPLKDLSKAEVANSDLWDMRLKWCVAALKTHKLGQLASGAAAESLQSAVEERIQKSTFANHPSSFKEIAQASESVLQNLMQQVEGELEICFKPFSHRIVVTDTEWSRSRDDAARLLVDELKSCEDARQRLEETIGGRRKTQDVVSYIDRVRQGDVVLGGSTQEGAGGFSAQLLSHGMEAVFLRDRADIIRMRLKAVRSRLCNSSKNKTSCPEVFLNAVADRLTSTADMFLQEELLQKYFDRFPRALEQWGKSLDDSAVERFAREDPSIARHIDVVRKKDSLERALRGINNITQLEAVHRSTRDNKPAKNSWSFLS